MRSPDSDPESEMHDLIARVSLNWGLVENLCGAILADLYKLEREAAWDLIYAIDLRKKIDLIVKNFRVGVITAEAAEYVKALEYANKHYRKNRNIVAHGMLNTLSLSEPKVVSFMRDQSLGMADLKIVLAQSRYTVGAVNGVLNHWCGDGQPEALPLKPPELPER